MMTRHVGDARMALGEGWCKIVEDGMEVFLKCFGDDSRSTQRLVITPDLATPPLRPEARYS
jgi:hypothetical protein